MATATAVANAPAKSESTGLAIKSDPRAIGFKRLFESEGFLASLKQTLPRHIDPKRLIRVVLSAFQTNPELLECTPESVLLSLMRAASMGLEPDGGPLGQGYLVPFNVKVKGRGNGPDTWQKQCQFIPGYRGLVKLARNSGEVADVWAEVVYEKDEFEYELGLHPTLRHRRNDSATDAGALKYAYAVARFRDGERKFVVLNKREVEKAKSVSKSASSSYSPWGQWPEAMWRKTAVRQLAKLLPLSVEVQGNIAKDTDEDHPVHIELPDLAALPMPQELQSNDSESEEGDGEESQTPDYFADCATVPACDDRLNELFAQNVDAPEDELRRQCEARKEAIKATAKR